MFCFNNKKLLGIMLLTCWARISAAILLINFWFNTLHGVKQAFQRHLIIYMFGFCLFVNVRTDTIPHVFVSVCTYSLYLSKHYTCKVKCLNTSVTLGQFYPWYPDNTQQIRTERSVLLRFTDACVFLNSYLKVL